MAAMTPTPASTAPHAGTGATAPAGPAAPGTAARPRRRPRPRVWRGAVLLLAGAYFLVPLIASFVFTVHVPGQGISFEAYTQLLSADGFTESMLLSSGWPPPPSRRHCCSQCPLWSPYGSVRRDCARSWR